MGSRIVVVKETDRNAYTKVVLSGSMNVLFSHVRYGWEALLRKIFLDTNALIALSDLPGSTIACDFVITAEKAERGVLLLPSKGA